MRSLRENLGPRSGRIDRAIGLRFSRKDRTFEVNKLFIISGFLLGFCRRVIGPWALRENNAVVLVNQGTR